MAAKPKTRGSGPKTKAQDKKKKEQSARFIETARKLGVDESGEQFNRVVAALLPARKHPD